MNVVFMVEELSMKEFLNVLLPQIFPKEITFKIIPHSGKSDLKSSIPRKLKAWREPDTKFVIVQDQDSADCRLLKQELQSLCDSIRPGTLVRIACVELESWYWGDLDALSKAYGKDLRALSLKKKYRVPDKIQNPKNELVKLLPEHQQISGARKIAPYITIENNRSKSFQVFVRGVKTLIGIL